LPERYGGAQVVSIQDVSDLKTVVSPTKAAEIILAVGPLAEGVTREHVALGIGNAAQSYGLAQYRAQVKPKDATGEAQAVADACRELLAAVGITSPFGRSREGRKPIERDSIRQSLGSGGLFAMANPTGAWDGAAAVLGILRGVAELEEWAEALAARNAARAKPIGPGASKNEALAPLLDAMETIYMSAWERLPSLRRSKAVVVTNEDGDAMPVGFLRLLSEVFPLIAERGFAIPKSSTAIEQACHRWRRELKERGLAPFWHSRLG
jgi:hypothetical protein